MRIISTNTHGISFNEFFYLSLLMKMPPFSTSLVRTIASIYSSVADLPAGSISSKISNSSWSPLNLFKKEFTFDALV